MRRVHENPLAARGVLHRDAVSAAAVNRALRLIRGRNRGSCVGIRNRAQDDGSVWISVEMDQQDLSSFVQGEMHAILWTRIWLRHPDESRGLASGGIREVERELDLVPP